MAEYTLDITAHVCPMTLVKAKLRLEELRIGDLLTIRLRDGEARANVPQSLTDHGHAVLDVSAAENGTYVVRVRKQR